MTATMPHVESLVRELKESGLLNRHLSQICAQENLGKNGVKAELQRRIIDRIYQYGTRGDAAAVERLRQMIRNPTTIGESSASIPDYANTSTSISATQPAAPPPFRVPNNANTNLSTTRAGFLYPSNHGTLPFMFKPTPFYTLLTHIGDMKECEVMAQHRHTVSIRVTVSSNPILSRVLLEPALRVMVFCSGDNHGRQDIAFPHQSEIKVNGGDIKANLRGLKNKPGSTRPVDITKDLRLKVQTYGNNVEMTYALTSKKFYLIIFLVRVFPVEDLVTKLEMGNKITKETVMHQMITRSRDPDIVATSSVLSLKCPLSTLKMALPCRSTSCRHNQCFDGTSYLQLQEQGPTWLCPICNVPAPFESLAVDEYVRDILKNTSKSVEQVTVEPDGTWSLYKRPEPPSKVSSGAASSDDSDDDLVEITRSNNGWQGGTPNSTKTAMPALTSKPLSSTPQSQGSISGKRPIAAVIDLTSSGDDDEEPASRPLKRQHIVPVATLNQHTSTPRAYQQNGYSPYNGGRL